MKYVQPELFSPEHQVTCALGDIDFHSRNHPYLEVTYEECKGWMLDVDPSGGFEISRAFHENGDIIERKETVVTYCGVPVN